MHGCTVLIHVLPTVYVHLRRNQLCLCEYSWKQTFQHNLVCISSTRALWDVLSVCVCFSVCTQKTGPDWVLSCVVKFIHMHAFSLTPRYWHFRTLYAPFSKCILAYVPPVHLFDAADSFWMNIFVSFLFIDKNVNRFISLFLSFKKSFRSQRVFVVVSQKNVVDKLWWKLFINEIKTAARALNLGPSQALAQNAHALARQLIRITGPSPTRAVFFHPCPKTTYSFGY